MAKKFIILTGFLALTIVFGAQNSSRKLLTAQFLENFLGTRESTVSDPSISVNDTPTTTEKTLSPIVLKVTVYEDPVAEQPAAETANLQSQLNALNTSLAQTTSSLFLLLSQTTPSVEDLSTDLSADD